MSLPQIEDAFIASSTWPGPGSGTSSRMCRTVLAPGRVTPFMTGTSWPEPSEGGRLRTRSRPPPLGGATLLDRTHGQPLDQLVLSGEPGDQHRQRHDERRRAQLGQEQALAGDE